MSETKYTVELTEDELTVVCEALNLLSKVQAGSGHAIVDHLPLRHELNAGNKFTLKSRISQLMTSVLPNGVDGYTYTLPVGHPNNKSNGISDYLYKALKVRLKHRIFVIN